MRTEGGSYTVGVILPELRLKHVDLGPPLTTGAPAMHSLRQPFTADGAERKRAGQSAKTLSPETLQRAVTVAAVFGNMQDFAYFKYDFTGEAGQARRARAAVDAMLQGLFEPGNESWFKLHQVGQSIVKAITGSLAWNIANWPDQLFETASYPRRGVEPTSTRAEYIGAALALVNALAQRKLIDLSTIVGDKEVASLVDLVGAAKAMHGHGPMSVFGAPVPFLRVADAVAVDSWDGYSWTKAFPAMTPEASQQALTSHFAGRAAVCRAAIADVAHEAVELLRAVQPGVAATLDIRAIKRSAAVDTTLPRWRVGYPLKRRYTIGHRDRAPEAVEQTLVTKGLPHVVAAKGLGLQNPHADRYHLDHGLDVIMFEGFVDTPNSRENAVKAAREVIGAYVEGLGKIAGYLRYTKPADAASAATMCDELATLLRSFRAGPLGAPIANIVAAFKYPAALEKTLTQLDRGCDGEHGRQLAQAIAGLRAAMTAP